MNPTKDDNFGLRFGRLLTQTQRIANKVSYILNLTQLVVMSQDYSLPLLSIALYLAHHCGITA
jgi:hypothetical protein